MNINQAVQFAQGSNPNYHEVQSAAKPGKCSCRGACGNHGGPCMSACIEGSSTCKSCKPAK